MSNKSDYTPEEWAKLMDLPMVAATAVIMAAPNPMGLPDEVSAEGAAYEQLQQPGIETELLHALRADLHERWERRDDLDAPSPELPLYIGGVHYYDPVLERKELSALAGDVAAILQDRAMPEEAAAYKQFVMDTATAVAYASKEGGGFLGFGRKNITDRELSMLDTLSAALGIA